MPGPLPSRLVAAALALMVLALALACDKSPVRPAVTDIRLSVTARPAVGRPSDPVMMTTSVANAGTREVWRCTGCGCVDAPSITVLGPDGTPVALDDPKALRPMCPVGFGPFAPGTVERGGRPFTGTLYEQGSSEFPTRTYAAPEGVYEVVARFGYGLSREGPSVLLERRITFEWKP